MLNEQPTRKLYPGPDYDLMTIPEILDTFGQRNEYFPHRAINAARSKRQEITPVLINIVKDTVENYKQFPEKNLAIIYALFLLSEFREVAAFSQILALARLPDRYPEIILGDWLLDGLPQFIVSTYTGDTLAIKALIEDKSVHVEARDAGMRALLGLFGQGKLERGEIISFFKQLFHSPLSQEKQFVTHLINNATDMYPEELLPEIEKAFRDGRVDLRYIHLDDVHRDLERGKEACLERFIYTNPWIKPVENLKKEMMLKCKADPAVGRNDPCPCYSGKKFKKCCEMLAQKKWFSRSF